jgi:4-hydroxythreonine-4-phosphate dehydrogenase
MINNKPVIGITIGDTNGIGPEIIIKLLSDERIYDLCVPVVYGSTRVLSHYKKLLQNDRFKYGSLKDWNQIFEKQTNVVSCIEEQPVIEPGNESEHAAKYAFNSLNKALEDWKAGNIDAIITAPINKNTVAKIAGKKFTGHTEYITDFCGAKNSVMLLASENVRVGLVTNHLPISEVSQKLSTDLISEKIEILHQCLVEDFDIQKPRIAVLSLNPHAGDKGLLGTEEIDVIIPAISKAYKEGKYVFGPYPADGLFGSSDFKKFDAILAMYHDQGLAPFKAISFDDGVNITAGIPLVRTSPDHGTAYGLAGKGEASEQSMRTALFQATDMVRNRIRYKDIVENAMKKGNQNRD